MATPKNQACAVPLMACIAEDIIRELLNSKQLWSRAELVAEVDRIHHTRGGLPGAQSTRAVVKKALNRMRLRGDVVTPSYSMWARPGEGVKDRDRTTTTKPRTPYSRLWKTAPLGEKKQASTSTKSSVEQSIETVDVSEKKDHYEEIKAKKRIGEGSECIYVYYMPAYKELAQLKGEFVWPCKIGKAAGFVSDRIKDQGAATAFSESPVLALVINTNRASILERVIHNSLKLSNLKLSGPGCEWFSTTPEIVEAWYYAYMETLKLFDGTASVLSGEKNVIS